METVQTPSWITSQINVLEQQLKTHRNGSQDAERQLRWYRKLEAHTAKNRM